MYVLWDKKAIQLNSYLKVLSYCHDFVVINNLYYKRINCQSSILETMPYRNQGMGVFVE